MMIDYVELNKFFVIEHIFLCQSPHFKFNANQFTIKWFRTCKHTPLKFIWHQTENSYAILVIIIHSKRQIFELHSLLVEYGAFTGEHTKETYMMIIRTKFTPFYESFKHLPSRESPHILDSKLWCFPHRKPTLCVIQRKRSKISRSCRAYP
mgnify:CR=1 FL=1